MKSLSAANVSAANVRNLRLSARTGTDPEGQQRVDSVRSGSLGLALEHFVCRASGIKNSSSEKRLRRYPGPPRYRSRPPARLDFSPAAAAIGPQVSPIITRGRGVGDGGREDSFMSFHACAERPGRAQPGPGADA